MTVFMLSIAAMMKKRSIFVTFGLLAIVGGVLFVMGLVRQNAGLQQTAQMSCEPPKSSTVQLTGGRFMMGAASVYDEEGPARMVEVGPFDIDATEVTNAQFAEFVGATGYVTDAEKTQAGFGQAGGVIFTLPTPRNPNWWQFVAGTNWRHPDGPDSSLAGRDHEPVVQISYNDALAYAAWRGRRLPSEAEWEFAARAGSQSLYVWGDERAPEGREMANSWQGAFPIQNTGRDGFLNRAPVGCFPANAFGLHDMIGNVWEWTDTAFSGAAGTPSAAEEKVFAIKGGSYLCAPNFCARTRAAARQPQEAGFPTNHIGFRTVASLER